MKKGMKKLVLNRESLRVLREEKLVAIPGGGTNTAFGASYCTPCQTWENVPLCRPN